MVAMLIGIFQSLIIVSLLSKEQYGLIGLVASIAGIVGITQHLGLASSSTKEISQAKNNQDIFNVILASLSIRMLISLPISLILIFFASRIGVYYNNSEIVLPLKIFGYITLIQAFQSIFNSVISGTQRFKLLFSYQVLIAVVSLLVFLPLIYFYSLMGYFYALLIFNLIQTIALGFFSLKDLNIKFVLPTKQEFYELSLKLLKISLAIYAVKILFTAWQEIPIAYLGKIISLETLALFTFAFNLSSKLMSISDSVTDVNLPVFSKKSTEIFSEYFSEFSKNFNLLYYFIFLCGISVAYWSREILIGSDIFITTIGSLVGIDLYKNIYSRYSDSLVLFLPLLLSIIFYSYLNIFKSSFFVPLEKLKKMIITYFVLIFGTGFSYLFFNGYFVEILSMAYSLLVGSFMSFVLATYFIYKTFKKNLLDTSKILFTMLSILVGVFSSFVSLDFYSKVVIYLFYILLVFYLFRVNLLVLFKRSK
jgi:O-antigen/teichoic acid export membrane protein